MEKYSSLLKCINDKIADCEKTIEYYREETSKKESLIRELEAENKALKEKITDLTF